MTIGPKRFTSRNEGFTCAVCSVMVPPRKKSCRNHCTHCLSSLHVDVFPGDRREQCRGIMDPVELQQEHGEWVVVHKCRKCGKIQRNVSAEDDSFEKIIELSSRNG